VVTDSYNPKKALFDAYPQMRKLSLETDEFMNQAEETLAERELSGIDTSCPRAIQLEARWRTNSTSDYDAAARSVERLRKALDESDEPTALEQDAEGSFAPCTDEWFLKLDRSTDQLLARAWPWRLPPVFLEPIDDPIRMVTYLQDLCWSDVKRRGRDNRKELNLAISVIARLVLRGGQAGYLSHPSSVSVFERFVQDWQDPETGFFGVTYVLEDGHDIRTTDLSLTFHVARYAPHLVRSWHTLVDTLIAMKHAAYPQGWLEHGKMSDHNNYDVAELFARGWSRMTATQRSTASTAIDHMLAWCLTESVCSDGSIKDPDKGDMIPDSYYFAAAFLDTIGFFQREKRFWTDKEFPDTEKIRIAMIGQLRQFNSQLTVVEDTLERLNAGVRAHTNAVL
jgi:hypothetical protein